MSESHTLKEIKNMSAMLFAFAREREAKATHPRKHRAGCGEENLDLNAVARRLTRGTVSYGA